MTTGDGNPGHWSPDGSKIAFSAAPAAGEPSRIYVVPAEGGVPQQLTGPESGMQGDVGPTWSADGASLAFGGPWGVPVAERSIHVVDVNTKHISELPGSEGMWSPRWSPDGRFLAGLRGTRESTLVLYDPGTRKQTEVSSLSAGAPTWSWDGEYLFFASDMWVWRVRMRDRKMERVADLRSVHAAGWGWFATAPNNSFLTAREAGTEGIFAFDWEAP
jgi:Tol biopolymer transport system component